MPPSSGRDVYGPPRAPGATGTACFQAFFIDVDRRWRPLGAEPIELRLIGSVALMFQASYSRGTRDSDVLETLHLTRPVVDQLRTLAGPGTKLATRHAMYIEIVPSGIPFLPGEPLWRHVDSFPLTNFSLHVLDVVDVIVAKLKRFNANDVGDADAMAQRGLLEHSRLVDRFRSAFDEFSYDTRRAPEQLRR